MTTLVIGLSLRCSRHRRTETSEYDNIESTSASCRTAIDFTAIDFADPRFHTTCHRSEKICSYLDAACVQCATRACTNFGYGTLHMKALSSAS